MAGNPHLYYTAVGIAKEAAWGTAVPRTAFIPILEPRFNPRNIAHVLEEGYRGQAAMDYDLIGGVGQGEWGWTGALYVDTFPHLLLNLMGKVTKSGAGPYQHLFQAGTPPSHTIEWGQDVQPYVLAGARASRLALNFNGRDGTLRYTIQGQSKLGATCVLTPAAWTELAGLAGWQGNVTVGGAQPAVMTEAELVFERQIKLSRGLANTQDPGNMWQGPLRLSGRLTFEFTAKTEYEYAASNTPAKNAVVMTFSRAANEQIVLTMTKCGWRQSEIGTDEIIYTAVANINALQNTTDAGPCQVEVSNQIATAYDA